MPKSIDFSISSFVCLLCVFACGILFCTSCNVYSKAQENSPEKTNKNEKAIADAELNIEKYRKGNSSLSISDKYGKPIENATISVKQTKHDFKFGAYLKIDDLPKSKLSTYEKQFSSLFNYAVIGTYWDFVENKHNQEDWSWFEKEVEIANRLNLRFATAPILWGTNESGTPAWLPSDKLELSAVVNQQIETGIRKSEFADEIELVNEPLSPNPDYFRRRLGATYIENAFRKARELNLKKRLMINEYGVFGNENARNFNRDKYFELLTNLIQINTPIDVIGIQAHANGEWFEPANVSQQLERYAKLGKPIQITEFSSQTHEYDNRKKFLSISGGYKNGEWDDEKQAEFYREFYTVAFGNPNVEAIVTWGIDDERGWLPGIGVVDQNDRPKPNYKILDLLINHKWKTNLEGASNEFGKYEFRGFYGEYEISVSFKGKSITKTFAINKSKPQKLDFVL